MLTFESCDSGCLGKGRGSYISSPLYIIRWLRIVQRIIWKSYVKAAIERASYKACFSMIEREQTRPKVKL